jgi:hypothetical protein
MSIKEETMCAIANRQRLRGLTLRFVALIALSAAAIAAGASSARADYRVVQCDYTRTSYTQAGAVAIGAYSVWATNSCGNDYGLILRTGTDTGWTANGAGLAWQFTAPAGTTFDATALVHYGYDSGFGTAVQSDTGGFAGLPTCPTGPGSCWANPATVNAHYFQVRLMCFKSPNCHSDWAYTYTRNFEATVHDGYLPSASATGQLLSGDVASGVEGLNVSGSDVGGGVGALNIYVNGIYSRNVPICTPDVGGYAYQALKPCPDSASRLVQIDTEHDPGWTNGPNELAVCAADAGVTGSQNVSSPCFKRTVQVDNSCGGSGGTTATSLDAGADVGGSVVSRAALKSTQEPVIRGSVRDGGGNPVSGATVCVYQTTDLPDASRELATTATTQGNGRFATKLDPGPSRIVDVVYRFNSKRLSDEVQLDSSVIPEFTVAKKKLTNGRPVVFLGQLPGPNADGRAIALQARVGRKWRTFKQLRSESDGHFKGKYRFTQTSGRQRYIFRALIKKQGGYPYEPGASHKRKVIVHG